MTIKIVLKNGNIRYIKVDNEITITKEMFASGDVYVLNENGKTLEKIQTQLESEEKDEKWKKRLAFRWREQA